ncbi:MAG: hypothetical protein OXN95_03815 [bacterium]|nr:hypothetical protein [bacterium]
MASEDSREVVLRLNQQQLELVDQTIGRTEAGDRADLFLQALQEFHSENAS